MTVTSLQQSETVSFEDLEKMVDSVLAITIAAGIVVVLLLIGILVWLRLRKRC